VIDADRVAHKVMAQGTEETAAIAGRFGAEVIAADGSVDRAALGRIVFADPNALADLEAIVHPGTRRRILERLARSTSRVAVVEAIKLLEGPLVQHVQAIWVVTAPRAVRINRLVGERGLSEAEAARRVDAQNPEQEKVRQANVVLKNDGSLEGLRQQVEAAWRAIPLNAGHAP